jgi:hypothetical protein
MQLSLELTRVRRVCSEQSYSIQGFFLAIGLFTFTDECALPEFEKKVLMLSPAVDVQAEN